MFGEVAGYAESEYFALVGLDGDFDAEPLFCLRAPGAGCDDYGVAGDFAFAGVDGGYAVAVSVDAGCLGVEYLRAVALCCAGEGEGEFVAAEGAVAVGVEAALGIGG